MNVTIEVGRQRVGVTVAFTATGRFEPATLDYPGDEPVIEVEEVAFDDPAVVADLLRPDVLDAIKAACLEVARRNLGDWYDDDERWAA